MSTCNHNSERYLNPRGHLECRECRREANKRWLASSGFKTLPKMHSVRFGGMREAIIQRDGEQCVNCGMTREEHRERFGRDITVDHIDGHGRNSIVKNNDEANLQTLCLPCHGSKDIKRKVVMA
jgi:5-methylcytosine-specific restriction endonuclease McrA